MAHLVIVIAGPHSTAIPNTVCDGYSTTTMVIGVVRLHQQQQQHVSYQDHCQHYVLPLSALPARTSAVSNVCTLPLSASPTHPSPLCIACMSPLLICLHVHVDEGVLLADP